MNFRKTFAALTVAAVTGTGCVDLEVLNPNDPDRERALQTAADVEALVAGSYWNWWLASTTTSSFGPLLATMSNQHSATAANFAMVEFSSWPRVAAHNMPTDAFSGEVNNNWTRFYRAISSVTTGLQVLDEGEISLDDEDLMARVYAYGYFVLGVSHASAAISYDQAYIYDPSMTVDDVTLNPSQDVFNAAMGYLDMAIDYAESGDFVIPELWMGSEVTDERLIDLAYSYKARYRAAMARTPADRAAVNWTQVIADAEMGIDTDYTFNTRPGGEWGVPGGPYNMFRLGPWGQLSYQVAGMADQSGAYQEWMSLDPWDRHPNLPSGDPFLIITPDERFPQGSTVEEQQANQGTMFEIHDNYSAQWARPDRGSFRWSYYRPHFLDEFAWPAPDRTDWVEMHAEEMDLLIAEANYHLGNLDVAADIVSDFRTSHGLSATDETGVNTSCVPKLPDGTCGDLFEMLKWEVRMETMYAGLHLAPWYYHGRGWGDLAEGSFLELPVPGEEMQLLLLEPYTFGGLEGERSAPVGTYGY